MIAWPFQSLNVCLSQVQMLPEQLASTQLVEVDYAATSLPGRKSLGRGWAPILSMHRNLQCTAQANLTMQEG